MADRGVVIVVRRDLDQCRLDGLQPLVVRFVQQPRVEDEIAPVAFDDEFLLHLCSSFRRCQTGPAPTAAKAIRTRTYVLINNSTMKPRRQYGLAPPNP